MLMQWMAAKGCLQWPALLRAWQCPTMTQAAIASADVRFKVAVPVALEAEPISDAGAAMSAASM